MWLASRDLRTSFALWTEGDGFLALTAEALVVLRFDEVFRIELLLLVTLRLLDTPKAYRKSLPKRLPEDVQDVNQVTDLLPKLPKCYKFPSRSEPTGPGSSTL